MAQSNIFKSADVRVTSKSKEEQLDSLISQLNTVGERINLRLENINRSMEMMIEEMRTARLGADSEQA